MARGFAIEADETGWAVVDDRGTVWAGFAPGNPDAEFLSGFMLSLARESYGIGSADAARGHAGRLGLHRGRGDGLRTWDVRVDGRRGACLARDGRGVLQLRPPRRARLMLEIARCLYEVARADHALGEAVPQDAGGGEGCTAGAESFAA